MLLQIWIAMCKISMKMDTPIFIIVVYHVEEFYHLYQKTW